MATTVKIGDLPEEIARIMSEIEKEAHRASDQTMDNISKEALKVVQEAAPVHKTKSSRAGTYQKSIKRKKTKTAEFETEYTIYAGEYRLSHLLENGHLTLKGERTQAIPHFAKGQDLADKKITAEFEKNFKP